MKVPQLSPWIGKEEYRAIEDCFTNNWITEGPKSKEFSQKLLELTGAKYGVFAPNGTLALYLGLRAMGVGVGDEVIVPDFTFIASATSIEMTGATPVFVDVNRRNFQIDLSKAENLLTKKTKALMPVHIYGTVCDMDAVMKFAKKHNLKVIEDAAEAVGVRWKGKHSGTFGDVGIFSFFADKTITTGEGAFVVTDNDGVYENLLYLRNQGRIDRGSFIHPRIGYNFRMTDIQNAIGLVQLGKLGEIVKRKERIRKLYVKHLEGIKGIKFFEPDDGAEFVPFRMCILSEDASGLMAYMKSKEIETRTFFYPLHKQPAFSYLKGRDRKYDDAEFSNAIYGYEHGVCLPIFPTLSDEQVMHVCDTIREFVAGEIFYEFYDTIFKAKDYLAETKMIFSLSREYGFKKPEKMLEIGCGTGNHTLLLSKKVRSLDSLDIDSRMTRLAETKLKNGRIENVSILTKSVEELEEKNYDLVVAMFNVVTYIKGYKNLLSFIGGVSDKLRPGGIFVFDCWNGVAALLDPPKSKKMEIVEGNTKVDCVLTSKTDSLRQTTTLNYDIVVSDGKKKRNGKYSFDQTLWTPMQIEEALKEAGLEVLLCSALMKPDRPATDKDWKIMFCARKPK